MGARIVDQQQVAQLNLRKRTLPGKLIVVLAKTAGDIIDVVRGPVPLAADGHMMISPVHGRAHQVDRAGVHADVIPVDLFFVHGMGHQPAAGAGHPAAQLRLDGDAAFREDLFIDLPDALADSFQIRFLFLRPIGNADAAGQVHKGKLHFELRREIPSQGHEHFGQARIISRIDRVGSQEGVQAESRDAFFFQDGEAFLQLRQGKAVFRLPRVSHDRIADGESAAGIIAQTDRIGETAVGPQQADIGQVVQVDEGTQLPRLGEFLGRHGVSGKDHILPGETAGFRQSQLRGGRAVQAAALVLHDPQDRRIRQGLDGEILLKIFTPGEGRLQPAGTGTDSLFVIEMERRRKLFRRADKYVVIQRKIRHGTLRINYEFIIKNS